MRPKTSLIRLHSNIDTKNYEIIEIRLKANVIKLHTCHSRVTPDLKLTQMI